MKFKINFLFRDIQNLLLQNFCLLNLFSHPLLLLIELLLIFSFIIYILQLKGK